MPWNFPLRPPVVIVPGASAPAEAPAAAAEAAAAEVDKSVTAAAAAFALRWLFMRGMLVLMIAQTVQTFAGMLPPLTELVYSQGIYYYIARVLSFLNRFFGFSLGELFLAMLAMWFIGWTIWYIRRSFRNEVRFFSVIKLLFLHLFWTAVILFIVFVVVWGLNYQRTPIAYTLGLESRPPRSDELQVIASRIVKGINDNYAGARDGQDPAEVTRLPYQRETLNRHVDEAFQRVPFLKEASAGGLAVAKPLYLSHLASLMGFSGVFLPFTGEATYNREAPAVELPFTIANQKAHQLGYAREDEANFIAYVVCTNAEDPFLRYSGFLHGVKVLEYIERGDVGRYRDGIGPGPSADLEASRRFWQDSQNPEIHGMANWVLNLLLRINRVPSGVDNYNEDIPLIIGYDLKSLKGEAQDGQQ